MTQAIKAIKRLNITKLDVLGVGTLSGVSFLAIRWVILLIDIIKN